MLHFLYVLKLKLNLLQQVYVASVRSRTAVNRPITLGLLMAYTMYSGWLFLNNFVAVRTGIFMDWPPDHSV